MNRNSAGRYDAVFSERQGFCIDRYGGCAGDGCFGGRIADYGAGDCPTVSVIVSGGNFNRIPAVSQVFGTVV